MIYVFSEEPTAPEIHSVSKFNPEVIHEIIKTSASSLEATV